jgi:hypothetical protein
MGANYAVSSLGRIRKLKGVPVMTPVFGPGLMGVLIASTSGGRMSIMTTRRRESPEQIVRRSS